MDLPNPALDSQIDSSSAILPQPTNDHLDDPNDAHARKDICVIGAGPCGLAALKIILEHPSFKVGLWRPVAFEARSDIGGIWLPAPATPPSSDPPETPLYDSLTTNLPHPVMAYPSYPFPPSTSLYPPSSTVLQYLRDYASHFELETFVQLGTLVESVNWDGPIKKWKVRTRRSLVTSKMNDDDSADSGKPTTHHFDLVIVANGHYRLPRYPITPGLQAWLHSSRASHSVYYRNPSHPRYAGDTILVIGAGPSGLDISSDLRHVANKVIIHSITNAPNEDLENGTYKRRGRVKEFLDVEKGKVLFEDGTIESGIKHAVLATGYKFSFPFLEPPASNTIPNVSVPPGIPPLPSTLYNSSYHIFPLAKHIFPLVGSFPPSSMAFLGLPFRVVPFPLVEAQMRTVLKVFESPKSLDGTREAVDIISHYESLLSSCPPSGDAELSIARRWHLMDNNIQFDYRDALHQFAGDQFSGDEWKVPEWVKEMYAKKLELRVKWKEVERMGEKEVTKWVGGVGSKGGEEGVKEWVNMMKRLLEWDEGENKFCGVELEVEQEKTRL